MRHVSQANLPKTKQSMERKAVPIISDIFIAYSLMI